MHAFATVLSYTRVMNLAFSELELPLHIRPAAALTDEQLERFCSDNNPWRIEREPNGELIVRSPTGIEGAGQESDLGLELGLWARADGRGRYFGPSAGFTLPDTSMRAADAVWMSWDRWNTLSPQQRKGFARVCPEFVIEVRSETDRLRPLQQKMQSWVANGAELAWLIDPARRVVEIYRPGEPAEVHQDPSSVQGDGPVRGFELVMQRIWG
jgi:Uma2 family endonuclease